MSAYQPQRQIALPSVTLQNTLGSRFPSLVATPPVLGQRAASSPTSGSSSSSSTAPPARPAPSLPVPIPTLAISDVSQQQLNTINESINVLRQGTGQTTAADDAAMTQILKEVNALGDAYEKQRLDFQRKLQVLYDIFAKAASRDPLEDVDSNLLSRLNLKH